MVTRERSLHPVHEDYAASLREWAQEAVRAGRITSDVSLEAEVEWIPYGVRDEQHDAHDDDPVAIVATYGLVEGEYASIRRGAAIVDAAQRGVIRVSGSDRHEFLNRLLTQQVADLGPGRTTSSFWLNRTGRIDADLFIIETGDDAMLLDLDVQQVRHTIETLEEYRFAEDVAFKDETASIVRLSVHGPMTMQVLGEAGGAGPVLIAPGGSTTVTIAGVDCVVARHDVTGEVGVELFVPIEQAEAVWRVLVETDQAISEGRRRVRPIGWYAFNIARIEAGAPLFNIDFGPNNLPHETGILHDRVHFRKGCYIGQEVVARMESRGRSKQRLVGIRFSDEDGLPVAGAQVFSAEDAQRAQPIGAITSSTLSPMLGADSIAFAMVRSKNISPDATVIVHAEGEEVRGTMREELAFWKRGGENDA